MAIDSAHPWDITLTIAGTVYGFMLEAPEGESKQLMVQDAGPPETNRLNTAAQQIASLYSPRIDIPFAMRTWEGGLGQFKYDLGDPDRFWWSRAIVTHVEGKAFLAQDDKSLTLTGSTGDITGIKTWIDNATGTRYDFLWEGVNLWRRDASNNSNVWIKVFTAGQNITDFAVMDDVGLIASVGDTPDFYTQADLTAAATWTPTSRNHSTMTDEPKLFHIVRGTTYAAFDNNSVFTSTDPTADSWVGPINTSLEGNIGGPPGDNSYPMVRLASVGDFLFVLKQDGIYGIDSSQDIVEAVWQWKEKPSALNFKYSATGVHWLSYNVGNEVYIYNPTNGANNPIGMARQAGFNCKEVLGVAQDNRYLYVLAKIRVPNIRTADSVALFRCTLARANWQFECLWEDTDVSDGTYGYLTAIPAGTDWRVYWGYNPDTGDTQTLFMDIPSEWDESASSTDFASTGELYTSVTESNFAEIVKRHMFIDVDGQDLSATYSIAVAYSLNGGVTFTSLATLTADNTSTDYTSIESRDIVLRFTWASDGSDTAILRRFAHHTRPRFRYLEMVIAALRITDYPELRHLQLDDRDATKLWDDIKTVRTSDDAVAYADYLGNSFNVSIDTFTIRPTRHEGPGENEFTVEIAMTRADKGV